MGCRGAAHSATRDGAGSAVDHRAHPAAAAARLAAMTGEAKPTDLIEAAATIRQTIAALPVDNPRAAATARRLEGAAAALVALAMTMADDAD